MVEVGKKERVSILRRNLKRGELNLDVERIRKGHRGRNGDREG